MNILDLPNDIILEIMLKLKITENFALKNVCRKFKLLYNDIEKRNKWICIYNDKYYMKWNKIEELINYGFVFCKFKNNRKYEFLQQIINYTRYNDYIQLITYEGNILLVNINNSKLKILNLKKIYSINDFNLLVNYKYKRKGIKNIKN